MARDVRVRMATRPDSEIRSLREDGAEDISKIVGRYRPVRVREREHSGIETLEPGGDRGPFPTSIRDRVDAGGEVSEPLGCLRAGRVEFDQEGVGIDGRSEGLNVRFERGDVGAVGRHDDTDGPTHCRSVRGNDQKPFGFDTRVASDAGSSGRLMTQDV
ncbi:hypothetical protein HLRTI_000890 [Halorhabdus tiamatea SARL4B]|uniref:Uncharacterized protein n=1 Tax=Halorhabdus tiamatea SARL4B TaxID=1033806 RepID=U2DMW4_9EURY|nr:hypothetical protein HLRTI_000890 [Halorhabdus tiamatea SARL4B]